MTTKPADIPTGGPQDWLHMLRLSPGRWNGFTHAHPVKAAAMVAGSWLVLAWGRFGFQGASAPRAIVRFVLVGVYGWLGLILLSLVGLWLLDRLGWRGKPSTLDDAYESLTIDPIRVAQLTGLAHQPLLILAIAVQIGQAIPIPLVIPFLTIAMFALWFPGQLLNATASAAADSPRRVAPVTAIAYLAWLATAGRYLLDQAGHLI